MYVFKYSSRYRDVSILLIGYTSQAKTQKAEQQKAASKILAGTQNIKGLEEKLQVQKIEKHLVIHSATCFRKSIFKWLLKEQSL